MKAMNATATVDSAACRVEVTDAGQGCYPPGGRPPEGLSDEEAQGYRTGRRTRRGTVLRDHEHGAGDHWNLAESGRGFAIMRACVDAVTLHSVPGEGTHVVLDKRIHWEKPLARSA